MSSLTALVIINPQAGKAGAEHAADLLIAELEKKGLKTEKVLTCGISDARDIAIARASAFDLVVACGGDGTLSEVISGLMRLDERPPVGFLPVGSACDVATTFKLPSDPIKAAAIMTDGLSFAIDIGKVSGSPAALRTDLPSGVVPPTTEQLPDYFTYVASFGAFTETSYATNRALKKRLGHFAYVLTGAKALGQIRKIKTTVAVDGNDLSGTYIFGGVLNSFSVGGMVKLDDVIFDDGLFEVMLVQPPRNVGQFSGLLSRLLRRKTGGVIVRERGQKITFSFEEPVSFTVDGEYGGTRTTWTIENIPRAIYLKVKSLPFTD